MPNEYPMPDLEKLIRTGPSLTDRLKYQPTETPTRARRHYTLSGGTGISASFGMLLAS